MFDLQGLELSVPVTPVSVFNSVAVHTLKVKLVNGHPVPGLQLEHENSIFLKHFSIIIIINSSCDYDYDILCCFNR